MENRTSHLELLFERAEAYGKTTLELNKLRLVEKMADAISSLFSRMVILVLLVLFFVLTSIGFALWLGELMGKSYYGFLAIGALYLSITLLVLIFKNSWLKTPMNDAIIIQLNNKRNESEKSS